VNGADTLETGKLQHLPSAALPSHTIATLDNNSK
jgi:hypothetical protein